MTVEQYKEMLREYVAEFVNRESNRTSLITVTEVTLSAKKDKATVLVTVFPEDQTGLAITFLERRVRDLRKFVMEKIKNRRIPHFSFARDRGEENRRAVESF